MAMTFRLRRGPLATLPALREGELGFTTDEGMVYIGTANGNRRIGATSAYDGFVSTTTQNFLDFQTGMSDNWVAFQNFMTDQWSAYKISMDNDWQNFHDMMVGQFDMWQGEWEGFKTNNIQTWYIYDGSNPLFDENVKMSADYLKDGTNIVAMTTAERDKLAGIEEGATNYQHPATHPADMITDTAEKVIMTAAERTKLTGIQDGATNYQHPTGDGNLHVPATGTTSNGKVLTAGPMAGSMSWQPAPITSVITLMHVNGNLNTTDTNPDLLAQGNFYAESSRFGKILKVSLAEKGNGNARIDVTDGTNTVSIPLANANNASPVNTVVNVDCTSLADNAVWNIKLYGMITSGEYVVSRFLVQGIPVDLMAPATIMVTSPNYRTNVTTQVLADKKNFPINYAIDTACKVKVVAKMTLEAGCTSAAAYVKLTTTDGTNLSFTDVTLNFSASGVLVGLIDFPTVIAPTVKVEVYVWTAAGFCVLNHYELQLVI